MSVLPPLVVSSNAGADDNPDNYPGSKPITEREWAIQTRAALIQQKKALQEQARALGMQISAIEKKYQIDSEKKGK